MLAFLQALSWITNKKEINFEKHIQWKNLSNILHASGVNEHTKEKLRLLLSSQKIDVWAHGDKSCGISLSQISLQH